MGRVAVEGVDQALAAPGFALLAGVLLLRGWQ
jgi:hypothetical protein